MENKLQIIRNIRKNKKNVNPADYTSLKEYARDCVLYGVSSQAYGKGAESIAGNLCHFQKETAEDRGDHIHNNKSIEYKFSIANSDGKINFVQLRPSHKIDYYILSYYDPKHTGPDVLEHFICESQALYSLIPEFGGYAHGTVKDNGKVTAENIVKNLKNGCEYAVRPNTTNNLELKGCRLLKKLREINLIEEEEWTDIKKKLI